MNPKLILMIFFLCVSFFAFKGNHRKNKKEKQTLERLSEYQNNFEDYLK